MRRSREEAAETRRRIVGAASKLFRGRGIGAVSVADVMGELGMTVGGFYRHFDSKEALVAEAIDVASAESLARTRALASSGRPAMDRITDLLNFYLSTGHKDNPAFGCPVPALASEVAHEGLATKEAFTLAIERLIELAGCVLPDDSAKAREQRLRMAASMVGALVLARATSNPALADELLSAVRHGLIESARASDGSEQRKATSPASRRPRPRKRPGKKP
jgi:TetR/AcrR family transcriptional repressor of nem operon